ncbi:MAG: hypothetical protein R3344_02745 [Acidobacteriota bacterium]|nr:hypothetical protein [Acidobacteriota bacterium]
MAATNTEGNARKAIVLEVLDGVLRSWWTVIAGVCLGLTVAVMALHNLPKTYQARTIIFVTAATASRGRAAVPDDMRMRIKTLRERVLSRQYLNSIIDQHYDIPPTERGLEELRDGIASRVQADVRSNQIFLQYADNDPVRCADVANALAQLFIDENTTLRIETAQEKLATFEEIEAERLAELNALDDKISEFKSKHASELSDHSDSNNRMLDRRRTSFETNKINLAAARERLRSLELQKAETLESDDLGAIGRGGTTIEADPLAVLKAELRDLRNRYSDEHPSVKGKKREIEEYIANRASAADEDEFDEGETTTTRSSPVITNLENSIRETKAEIARIESEQEWLQGEIAMYERRIEKAPLVQNELEELTKGHRVLSDNYEESKTQVEAARQTLKLEEKQEGNQFEIIDPALPPTIPAKPNPMALLAVGVSAGLLFFVGPIIAKRLLAPTVASEAGLAAISDVPILVSIPRVQTDELARLEWRKKTTNVGLAAASIVVLATALATLSLS